jgi:uncharacterized protein (DUF302 family)
MSAKSRSTGDFPVSRRCWQGERFGSGQFALAQHALAAERQLHMQSIEHRAGGTNMSEQLGFRVDLPLTFEAAAIRVREVLKQEGFGVLTEVDLRAAFREKLGREFRPYVILGACNPPLAFRAISADPSIGLLLPCNVTLEWIADGRTVRGSAGTGVGRT